MMKISSALREARWISVRTTLDTVKTEKLKKMNSWQGTATVSDNTAAETQSQLYQLPLVKCGTHFWLSVTEQDLSSCCKL